MYSTYYHGSKQSIIHEVCLKTIKTKTVFTKTEMKN